MIWLRYVLTAIIILIPSVVLAQMSVDFESTPLFAGTNLLPGDAVSRIVTVTNNGPETETVQFDFTEVVSGELANVTELAVSDDDSVYVFDTFSNLFSTGPHSLGSLAAGESRTYTFAVAIPTSVGNSSQNSQFSFDLLIGFSGEAQVSDTSSSGGGGGGTQTLQLFNEIAIEDNDISGAFLAWNSNRTASTYLVCGNVANGPFVLSETGPLFGYEFALAEEDLDTTEHGVAVSDFAPGDYECRPAGREDTTDGFTVGDAVQFTVALQGQVAGESISLNEADIQELLQGVIDTQLGSSVIGANSKGTGGMSYEEFRSELKQIDESKDTVTAATATPPAVVAEVGAAEVGGSDAPDASTLSYVWYLLLLLLVAILGVVGYRSWHQR